MTFPESLGYKIVLRITRVLRQTFASYAVAAVAIGVATAIRVMLNERLPEGYPFVTYYPASMIAALAGLWPAIWTIAISSVIAWYLFIPPPFGWSLDQKEALALLVYIFNSGLIVIAVTLLNKAVEQLSEQEQNQTLVLEREKLLHQELRHRTRNFLAAILAIINRSLVAGRTLGEAKQILTGRIRALAEANAMLAEAVWSGLPLREILARELEELPARVSMEGCDIVVNARASLEFSLLFHELRTNSSKYGALSAGDGHVSVGGTINLCRGEEVFLFVWRELNGPPILSPPTSTGFGSAILLDFGKPFGGKATMDFAEEGVVFQAQIPLKAITTRNSFLLDDLASHSDWSNKQGGGHSN